MRPLFARIAVCATFLASAACAGHAGPEVQGRLASANGFLGDWDFYPATCASRRDEVVLIEDKASKEQIRLVDRTRAPSSRNAKIDVHVARETDKGTVDLVFTDPACVQSTLEGGPMGYSGRVAIDCVTGEGGHVVGKIAFAGCK
jgi:hypothetical protein